MVRVLDNHDRGDTVIIMAVCDDGEALANPCLNRARDCDDPLLIARTAALAAGAFIAIAVAVLIRRIIEAEVTIASDCGAVGMIRVIGALGRCNAINTIKTATPGRFTTLVEGATLNIARVAAAVKLSASLIDAGTAAADTLARKAGSSAIVARHAIIIWCVRTEPISTITADTSWTVSDRRAGAFGIQMAEGAEATDTRSA